MKLKALIPTSVAYLRQAAGRGAAPPAFLAKLFGALTGGVALAQSVAQQLTAFLAVPAEAAVDAALKMAQGLGLSAIPALTAEQRAALGQQVDQTARSLTPETAHALQKVPAVEAATGVQGQVLETQQQQEEELLSVRQVLGQAQAAVGDARLLLQGWQFEVQRRLVAQIFLAFTGAKSVEERLQIVGDAGPALDALEQQLAELRATMAANSGAVAELEAQVEQADNDLLMVQTMRDLRDGKPVDDGLLRRMAVYYAERVGSAQADGATPAGTGTKKPKKAKTGTTGSGHKAKKKPAPAPAG